MTRTILTLAVLLWVGVTACLAADDLPIQVYACMRAASSPVIDGRLDDGCWEAVPVANGFAEFHGGALAPVQTFFRAAYDDAALYIAVTCDEPTPGRISLVAAARDELEIFRHEAVEIFLDPGHSHTRFYQLGVDAAGSLYDVGPEVGTHWDGKITAAALIGEKAWYVELRVPWQGLGVTPATGQVHGINVCRDRYIGAGQPWSSWARVMRTFHDPVRFGHLTLSPTAEFLSQLAADFRADERTGVILITAGKDLGDAASQGLLRAALAQLDARLEQLNRAAGSESDDAVRQALETRLGEYATAAEAARTALTAKSVDAETLARLELGLNRISTQLDKLLWQVRLEALLAGI
ncbi:MAG: hypothetical protein JSV65_05975 [Armatimonadota bacterium]|nr:MAG: hypothetical protein JSV65_05975 [Armatimonadota bacterium]